VNLDLGLLAFSFTAGVFAFFNPCGFALLPAYVSYYLASGEEQRPRGPLRTLIRGLSLGTAVGAGFITVFTVLGVIVSLLSGALGPLLPWVGAGVGVGLFVLGALLILGRAHLKLPMIERMAARLAPRGNPHPREQGLPFYYLYGVAYALASTSCTLPVFLIVVSSALASGLLGGLIQFGAYALGMTLMMIGLSVITVFSKEAIQHLMGPVMRFVRWAGAVGVMAAGAYLIYYNLFYSRMIRL
jgi:cytochrome c biogenesis protein CcdA